MKQPTTRHLKVLTTVTFLATLFLPLERVAADDLAAAVAEVVPRLSAEEVEVSSAAEAELETICSRAYRPQAEAERREVTKALITHLVPELSDAARQAIVKQLGLIGKFEVVRPLTNLLAEDPSPIVRDEARQALERLPSAAKNMAKSKLRAALKKAEGTEKMGLLRSLAVLKDFRGQENVLATLDGASPEVRLAALEVLAELGEISAVSVLEGALANAAEAERRRMVRAYLRFADALVDNSERGQARRIYERAMLLGTAPRCASLIGLARAGLQSHVDVIADATLETDLEVRSAACEAAVIMPGPRMSRALIKRLEAVKDDDDVRFRLMRVLARRGDAPSVTKLTALAADGDSEGVSLALRLLGGVEPGVSPTIDVGVLLPLLVDPLVKASSADVVRSSAELVLAHLPGDAVTPRVVELLSVDDAAPAAVSSGVHSALRVLRERGDSRAVDALSHIAFSESDDKEAQRLAIEALGATRSLTAAPALIHALGAPEPSARDAAVNALAQLDADEVGPQLLDAAASAEKPSARAAALRALGRLEFAPALSLMRKVYGEATTETDQSRHAALEAIARFAHPDDLPLLSEALDSSSTQERQIAAKGALRQAARLIGAAERDAASAIYVAVLTATKVEDDLRQALRGLSEVGRPGDLASVIPFFDRSALQRDAGRAALRLAERLAQDDRERAVDVLRKITDLDVDEATATQAVRRLGRLGVEINLARQRGCVTHWWILGPIPDSTQSLWETSLAVEPSAPEAIAVESPVEYDGGTYTWKHYHTPSVFGLVDMRRAGYSTAQAAAYFYAEVIVPAATKAVLRIGSDDHVACWLNGAKIHSNRAFRRLTPDQDDVEAQLRAGSNYVLLKVINVGGDWGVTLRFADLDGKPLVFSEKTTP